MKMNENVKELIGVAESLETTNSFRATQVRVLAMSLQRTIDRQKEALEIEKVCGQETINGLNNLARDWKLGWNGKPHEVSTCCDEDCTACIKVDCANELMRFLRREE